MVNGCENFFAVMVQLVVNSKLVTKSIRNIVTTVFGEKDPGMLVINRNSEYMLASICLTDGVYCRDRLLLLYAYRVCRLLCDSCVASLVQGTPSLFNAPLSKTGSTVLETSSTILVVFNCHSQVCNIKQFCLRPLAHINNYQTRLESTDLRVQQHRLR